MNKDLSKACDTFVEGIGRLAATVGVSRVIGQLYAMLFLSQEPLCLDDMVERLKISKGNASLDIRKLESLGVAKTGLRETGKIFTKQNSILRR